MPRKLELRFQSQDPEEELLSAAAILNDVRSGRLIGEKELHSLKEMINHSLVGTSKLLHFANPHLFAIWDSNVYIYINDEAPYDYRLKNLQNYFAFL